MSGSNRLIQGRGVGLGTNPQNFPSLICSSFELLLMSLFTQAWVLVAASASGGDLEVSALSAFAVPQLVDTLS